MTSSYGYFLGDHGHEKARLSSFQPETLEAQADKLLDFIGVAPGWRAIDVGCGPRGILELLSNRVGAAGETVGIDASETYVQAARELAAERALTNVRVVCVDARSTGLPRETFDLAHARHVLINLADPERVIAEMVDLVRPGGWVALQDSDWTSWECDPPHPAWTRTKTTIFELAKRNGNDLTIGRRVHRLLRDAGLHDIHLAVDAQLYPAGHGRRDLLLTFGAHFRDALIASGLATKEALASDFDALKAHLANPEVLVVSGLLFQACARKAVT